MHQALKFGRDQHLVGVLQQPADGGADRPAIIIPNAGFVPHTGPFRLHVHLARKLAESGISSLRFDLSGLGDSAVPGRREPLQHRKMADLADAISVVQSNCQPSVVLVVGLCSGATDAHRIALVDQRVAAVAMLDPVAYPNRLSELIDFARRGLSPRRWWRRIRRGLAARPAGGAQPPAAPRIHKITPAPQFAAELEQSTSRGVKYLFVYTGAREYQYRRQLFSIVTPATPKSAISVKFFAECDHTLVLRVDREKVVAALISWLSQFQSNSAG